jgi:uncharacterized protein YndB with AHSA1/START domain
MHDKRSESASPPSKGEASTGISKHLTVNVPGEVVFRSVSTADGFRSWWCRDISGSDAKGGELVLKFPRGHVATVSLAKSAKPSKVEWVVKDHNAMTEWIGTKIQFDIQPVGPDRAEVSFLHTLAPSCECYASCDGAWGFLMGSLKGQLESGRGTPA